MTDPTNRHDTDPSALEPDTDPGGHAPERPPADRPLLTERSRDELLLRLVTAVEEWRRQDNRTEIRLDRIDANLTLLVGQERRLGSEVAGLGAGVEAVTSGLAALPCRRSNGGVPDGCQAAE